MEDWLASEEFNALMERYRTAPGWKMPDVVNAFDAVVAAICEHRGEINAAHEIDDPESV